MSGLWGILLNFLLVGTVPDPGLFRKLFRGFRRNRKKENTPVGQPPREADTEDKSSGSQGP
jgi:hypothetical protein